ncbi:aminotransferase class I/II-fold pyridoxal phosphate-dependent enzyme [Fulvivirga sp. 29W222]|uniref:O-succinylhomoserine sulfhydrylase n=1 Tax=Fulvivirga marina TaxID=2494733 RepID=A0A937KCE9_9BACT|nr:aminotransferase class I/II-fold pyridoxal phosphate-dependent enzyme [Fulvivirga marina]MBL6447304.1 aminotransferase class I/II-fold pyridoxal phosphate-dependent enzyme [Fulvivirga marina]
MPEYKHFETKAIRNQSERSGYNEHSVPVYMTSSFTFEDAEQARALFADELDGNIYTRFSNPNNTEFINKLCAMEGTEDGIATASGMAAMFSSMAALLKNGDHILASRSVFGSTHQLFTQVFPKWGIEHTYADINNQDEWEDKIKPNTKMIFVETPSNPGLDIIDLEWLGLLAKRHNLILNVDNCFATPYLQQPAKYGAHLVTHSATKFIDGQGRTIAGAILGTKELIDEIRFFTRHTGPSLSPFNGWLLSKSLETLAVRMDRHCDSAIRIAEYLEGHDELELVKYPFLGSHPQSQLAKKQMKLGGGLVSFVVTGGFDRGRKFLNSLKMMSLTANLGDSRTIATHPASTTHSKLTDEERAEVGILPGLVRISVGLENVNDILEDIENALRASK